MITKNTVFILGAGASAPYGFPTGKVQLDAARSLQVADLILAIAPISRTLAPDLQAALIDTGERSIDAMLRADSHLLPAAKALIARDLLRVERNLLIPQRIEPAGYWYRSLFSNLPRDTIKNFHDAPVKIFTYNYDRSLDDFLWRAVRHSFPGISNNGIAETMDRIGPFHLHGQLGRLHAESAVSGDVVIFGGDATGGGITDGDILAGVSGIKLISETTATDAPFLLAHQAIANASMVIFLGFSFNPENVKKLRLRELLKPSTDVFASGYGLTEPEGNHMKGHSGCLEGVNATFGREQDDVARFLSVTPHILGQEGR
jgi:hypothetical protein